MSEPLSLLTIASLATLALAMTCLTLLKAWHGWLELKRLELTGNRDRLPGTSATGGRIELADLRERVRKLEAIAQGIDL